MILFRKFRIKKLLAREKKLVELITKYRLVMSILQPGLVLSDVHLDQLESYLDECEQIAEKLLHLGVAKRETDQILGAIVSKKETA